MAELAFSLGIVLLSLLAFAAFFVFGLVVTIVVIMATNLIFLTLTALSFTSAWPARWRP